MKFFIFKKIFKRVSNLYFGISILSLLALISSLGSFIEQDEPLVFYEENYSKPIYGFLNSTFILKFGLDHIYTTWWFYFLLLLFGLSLISCTITRQFPLFLISKDFIFKKKKASYLNLPFAIKIVNLYYLKEIILLKLQNFDFYLYQKQNLIYGYKGLIGRISPILVHFSLILILSGTSLSSLLNFKAQELLPKGELFHIQNPLRLGIFTSIPQLNIRVNDFWVEYDSVKIHQFYSNLSILDDFGHELKEETISVNNPLKYKNIDFYQSDWNLLGIRLKNKITKKIYELPLFPMEKGSKSWITWIQDKENIKILIFDQLQNLINIYDLNGNFLQEKNVGDFLFKDSELKILEILTSTGILIKYDPSIFIIYLGFGFLMITACLSYLPYTQVWIFNQHEYCWIGSCTNRGKIQLEIEFENLIRYLEYQLTKILLSKNE